MSHQRMLDLLKTVNLTRHGYTKEVTNKLVREPGSDKRFYEKSLLFYKETNCSRGLLEVDRELQKLMPGNFQCLFSLLLSEKQKLNKISYECLLLIFKLLAVVSGIFKKELVKKIDGEIVSKNLTEMKRCKVGLEVHFKEGCSGSKNESRRRKKRGSKCKWCLFCWNSALSNWSVDKLSVRPNQVTSTASKRSSNEKLYQLY